MHEQRASATALMVALSLLREGERAGLASAQRTLARAALRTAGVSWRVLGWLASHRAGKRLLGWVESVFEPGMAQHHCARKRWLQQRLFDQPLPRRWLWLGPGFDAAPRIAAAAARAIELIECEHPASLALRRRALACLPVPLPAAKQELSLRWPEERAQVLLLAATAPSTLIIEGVLMYWRARDLEEMLERLARLPKPPRLLISALAEGRDSVLRRHWLRARRESFRWRADADALIERLAAHGYRCEARWQGSCFGEYMLDCRRPP